MQSDRDLIIYNAAGLCDSRKNVLENTPHVNSVSLDQASYMAMSKFRRVEKCDKTMADCINF